MHSRNEIEPQRQAWGYKETLQQRSAQGRILLIAEGAEQYGYLCNGQQDAQRTPFRSEDVEHKA
jgi:hypothetical protein